jgi:hypothetical protein
MMDLYKAYLSDLGSVGARYSTANSFYMTVVTALLGVLALIQANKPFSDMRVEIVVTVAAFAVVICWIWRKTIDFYGDLFAAKFDVLREMEKQLPFQVFAAERQLLADRKAQWLLHNERRVPLYLAVFFVTLALLAVFFKALSTSA